jgi:hypothetical protein
MDATVWIALWAALFLGTFCYFIGGGPAGWIGAVGEQPYRGIPFAGRVRKTGR